MAIGKLGAMRVSTANTVSTVYTVPTGKYATININCVNAGTAPTNVTIGIGIGTTISEADIIEYKTVLESGGVLERTGIVCSSGEKVLVKTATSGTVVVRVHGFEQ